MYEIDNYFVRAEINERQRSMAEDTVQYDPKIRLGKGYYANVFPGTFRGIDVAVKRVQLRLQGVPPFEEDKEIVALRSLNHPNVIELLRYEDREEFRLYVLERCATSLDKVLNKTYQDADLLMLQETRMICQLASGLYYIHEQNFLHLDIKPDNVLVSHNGEQIHMKWADFGLSERAGGNGEKEVKFITGASAYVAAEVASQPKNGRITVTTLSDIFAAGCVLFRIVHPEQAHPYGEESAAGHNIKNENLINDLQEDHFAFNFIRRMVSENALERSGTLSGILESYRQMALASLCSKKELNETEMHELRELLQDDHVNINGPIIMDNRRFTPILLLCSKNRSDDLVHILRLFLTNHRYQRNDPDIIKGFSILCANYNNSNLLAIARLFVDHRFRLVNDEIIELLIHQGANLNHPGPNRRTALHSLCENYPHANLVDIVRLMIQHGAHVNIQQRDNGYTPLHCLCQYYRQDNLDKVAECLIDGGADAI